MGEDGVVFPDFSHSSPSADQMEEVTTISNKSTSQLSLTALVLIIIAVVLVLLLSLIFLYRRYKRGNNKGGSVNGGPNISLPTLGTHYEKHSLLSINTVDRKSSIHSEPRDQQEEERDVFDGRVSRYIDSSLVNMEEKEFKINLDVTLDNNLGDSNSFSFPAPPLARAEDFSRPVSMAEILSMSTPFKSLSEDGDQSNISIIGGEGTTTMIPGAVSVSRPISRILEVEESGTEDVVGLVPVVVQVQPPSPLPRKTIRPKSELVEVGPPKLPAKKRLTGASSEVNMGLVGQTVQASPKAARSDSHLAIVPPLPPKSKPFLPPKQMINKSKEDMERINQEILNSTGDLLTNGFSRQGSHLSKLEGKDVTDEDYDFPANSGVENEESDEEYDEPCPVLPEAGSQEDLQSGEETQQDYDDPVQRYHQEQQDQIEEAQQDYDDPVHRYHQEQQDQIEETQQDYDDPVHRYHQEQEDQIKETQQDYDDPVQRYHQEQQDQIEETQQDYDDPVQSYHQEQQNHIEETQQDYDDPVQRYHQDQIEETQ